MISRDEAKAKIKDIVENDSNIIKTGITLPIKRGQTFNVYRIPLTLLVPNILNDRITWKIREYEAESGRKLSIDSDVDVDYLYNTILNEHPGENSKTMADLARNGQQVDGVISDETQQRLSKEERQTWQYLKGAKKLPRTAANGHEYIFSEGPIAMVDAYDKPARTMLTSEGGFSRTTHIVKDKKTGRIRLLTAEETERIQGFPTGHT